MAKARRGSGRRSAKQSRRGAKDSAKQQAAADRRRRGAADVAEREAYERKKEREARRNREASEAGRDIGDIPPPKNRRRRAAGGKSLAYFCTRYLPGVFSLRWSADHKKVIAKIERAVLQGGTFAVAMPRGFGKSKLCEAACLWALLYGYRSFVVLVGASEDAALECLESIKVHLETSELLREDFPEVCVPIAALEGINHRCRGQTHNGKRTRITWKGKQIVLPTIEGSVASGSILTVRGITGRIRGMNRTRADGTSIRPDVVIIDDPQTDESAGSPGQCRARARIIQGAILGLAGPGVEIAAVMPCTVIREGDLADEFLDPEKHPEWQGERGKALYAMPDRMDLWEKYFDIRADDLRSGGDGSKATKFYKRNRRLMDAGANVAWPQRKNPRDLSALQFIMNCWARLGDDGFFSEYLNEPKDDVPTPDTVRFESEWVQSRTNDYTRAMVPEFVTHISAYIDVHLELMYWAVCGWAEGFTGVLLDYGTWPHQTDAYFEKDSARRKISDHFPGLGEEHQVFNGLRATVKDLMGRKWLRDDAAELNIGICFIDHGYEGQAVSMFCRNSVHKGILLPAVGKGIGPTETPFAEYKKKSGDQVGHHWRIPNVRGKKQVRHILIDTNFWKAFLHRRMSVDFPGEGSFSFFGYEQKQRGRIKADHRWLGDHFDAERGTRTEAKGRTVVVFKQRPGWDNHGFDCVVGCAVGASKMGIQFMGEDLPAENRGDGISLLAMRKRRAR